MLYILILLITITRRPVLQKVRDRSSIELSLLVDLRFQVLFHSPPGVLFTVPSRYYALSVTKEYLALGGGPPIFTLGFSCLVLLSCSLFLSYFKYGTFTLFGSSSQKILLYLNWIDYGRALPRSLAAT